jgi:hypothetical protein
VLTGASGLLGTSKMAGTNSAARKLCYNIFNINCEVYFLSSELCL